VGNEATGKQILSAQGRTNLQLDVIHVYTIHQKQGCSALRLQKQTIRYKISI